MKLYFDTCCYNRPQDGNTQDRIRQEGAAVLDLAGRMQTAQI